MEKIIEVDGAKHDFNTYPIYDAPMDSQLFILPSNDETMEDIYIVRDTYDKNSKVVSHTMFAKQLVNSVFFFQQEKKERIEKGYGSCWQEEKEHYSLGQEMEYLIQEKGYIPFSAPDLSWKKDMIIPDAFFPTNKNLLTRRQIINLFTMLDCNPKVKISNSMEEELNQILKNMKSK